MPLILIYNDVNEAYTELQTIKKHYTLLENTRNGEALVFQKPVLIEHTMPYRRVLFDPNRNANPFFHYMEAIWMLSGDNYVKFPASFAQNIKNYSDDGHTLYGAYGFRWRQHFILDQIESVIGTLEGDPHSRRAVIAMWDPKMDAGSATKDLPCNTHLYFRLLEGKLTMTICNRSNDLVWGMLGANIVHMSILHEYIANASGLPIGSLFQFTNNLHVYKGWDGEDKYTYRQDDWYSLNPNIRRWPFSVENFDWLEASEFIDDYPHCDAHTYKCRILRDNALPMSLAWGAHKKGENEKALHYARKIHDEDWQRGCVQWLDRAGARAPSG
jgi:thymidylate synthase